MKKAALPDVPGRRDYSQIPADFPQLEIASAVSGCQSKLALVKHEGRYYLPGPTSRERYESWDICEDLAQQLIVKSRESKAGKRAHMSESEILAQYCERLMKMGWGSDDEMRWVIRRTAALLGWPVPPIAASSF